MFLTRMGMNTKMIITGDLTQVDLPRGTMSGLRETINILKDVKGISFVYMNDKDIVRNKLVTRIVKAYEKAEAENKLKTVHNKNQQDINLQDNESIDKH